MDFLLKLYILCLCVFYGIVGAFYHWKMEIYPNPLDNYECCDNPDCGCGGQTIRDTWLKLRK